MPRSVPPTRASHKSVPEEASSPVSLLRSSLYFSFSPHAFTELGEHFPWLRRTARLANWVNRLDLTCAGLLLVSLIGLLINSPAAAGLLLAAWLLPALLYVGFAIWDESPLHELLQRAVVPISMLLLLSQAAALGVLSWWLLSGMLAISLSAFLIVLRGFYEWPLYLLQANVVLRQSMLDPGSVRPAKLMQLSDDLAELIVERLGRRNWLLRHLIRDSELPAVLRASDS